VALPMKRENKKMSGPDAYMIHNPLYKEIGQAVSGKDSVHSIHNDGAARICDQELESDGGTQISMR